MEPNGRLGISSDTRADLTCPEAPIPSEVLMNCLHPLWPGVPSEGCRAQPSPSTRSDHFIQQEADTLTSRTGGPRNVKIVPRELRQPLPQGRCWRGKQSRVGRRGRDDHRPIHCWVRFHPSGPWPARGGIPSSLPALTRIGFAGGLNVLCLQVLAATGTDYKGSPNNW